MRLKVQDIVAVKNNVGLEQHGEEPEVCVSQYGKIQHAILAHVFPLTEQLRYRIEPEWPCRVGRRCAPDAETCR